CQSTLLHSDTDLETDDERHEPSRDVERAEENRPAGPHCDVADVQRVAAEAVEPVGDQVIRSQKVFGVHLHDAPVETPHRLRMVRHGEYDDNEAADQRREADKVRHAWTRVLPTTLRTKRRQRDWNPDIDGSVDGCDSNGGESGRHS